MAHRRPISSILAISDTYPPVVGGAEADLQRVSAELIRRGYRVQVLTSGGAPMPAVHYWVDPEGVPVKILTRTSKGVWKDRLFALAVAWQLWRQRRDYDLVFFSMHGLHLFTGMPIARLLGKTIVKKFHGSTVISAMPQSRLGRLELGWLRRWASMVMVLNDEMMQEALDAGLPAQKIMHMPNPVDTDTFRPAGREERFQLRRRLGIREDEKILLYVGRLSHEKGLPPLFEGFAMARRQGVDVYLYLVGDGPMRADLEAHVSSVPALEQHVRFVGRVPGNEVIHWLQCADCFALVSANEGFSCALTEAMSAGLPAIVSAIPANTQLIVSAVNGFTVPVNDPDALASAISRVFSDERGRVEMGAAARQEILEKYTLEQVTDRYEALFLSL